MIYKPLRFGPPAPDATRDASIAALKSTLAASRAAATTIALAETPPYTPTFSPCHCDTAYKQLVGQPGFTGLNEAEETDYVRYYWQE